MFNENPNSVGEDHVLKPSLPPFPVEEEWTLNVLASSGLSAWEAPPRTIRERLIDGHLLTDPDPEKAAEIAEIFCSLTEKEQEKFWTNVQYEVEYEEWIAGDREHHPGRSPKAERKTPVMRPLVYSPTALSLEEALNRLERVRARGDEWVARCPVHEDRSPSLVVMENRDYPGEGFFWCYAGCTHLQIRAKLMAMRGDG